MFGDYDVTAVAGDCGAVDLDAPQSIQGDEWICTAHFASIASRDDVKGVEIA